MLAKRGGWGRASAAGLSGCVSAWPAVYVPQISEDHGLRKISGKMEVKQLQKSTFGGQALALWIRIFQNVMLFFADNLIFFFSGHGNLRWQKQNKTREHRNRHGWDYVKPAQSTLKLENLNRKKEQQGRCNPGPIKCTWFKGKDFNISLTPAPIGCITT